MPKDKKYIASFIFWWYIQYLDKNKHFDKINSIVNSNKHWISSLSFFCLIIKSFISKSHWFKIIFSFSRYLLKTFILIDLLYLLTLFWITLSILTICRNGNIHSDWYVILFSVLSFSSSFSSSFVENNSRIFLYCFLVNN